MTAKACNLEFVREDDFVEYFLFPEVKTENETEIVQLQKLLEKVNKLLELFQKDYIWHKDVIKLTARTNSSEILYDDDTEKRGTTIFFEPTPRIMIQNALVFCSYFAPTPLRDLSLR